MLKQRRFNVDNVDTTLFQRCVPGSCKVAVSIIPQKTLSKTISVVWKD